MKTQLLRTSFAALLVAAVGFAQQSTPMRADIPFSFIAGGTTLPAGAYTVDTSTRGIIIVKSVEQKASTAIPTMPVQSLDIQAASKLMFHRYGNTYLLSQVWTQGDYNGREAMVASSERELARRYKAPNKTVAVPAE
jgi:hypothetical protein